MSSTKKRVIIAIPGDNFSSKFLINWSNTLVTFLASEKYDFAIAPGTGSFVPYVRMQTLGLSVTRGENQKPFNGDPYDIWLTIDSDIIFSPQNILELLDSTEKHPVVSGLYRMSDLKNYAVVQNWDTDYFSRHGTFEFLTETRLKDWISETKLKFMPVNYTGLGFFACRREVLDKMTYPYFWGDLQVINGPNGMVIRDQSSEDVNFCHNIAKAGYQIVLNTELRVGHLKALVI